MALKHRKTRIIGPQTQHPAPGMADHAPGLVDHLLHHRLDAPALGLVTYGSILAVQRVLAHEPQKVHGHGRQLAHQRVGVELARGQALQVHAALELRVELLVRAVPGVQTKDPPHVDARRQVGRPALQTVFGQQQRLAVFVDGALGQAIDVPHGLLGAVNVLSQVKPGRRMAVQALAQRGARRHGAQAQRTGKEGIAAMRLDGIKVALALAQEGQVALDDGAAGHARAHGKGGIDQGVQIDMCQILAHQGEAGLGAQVVEQSLDLEFTHRAYHLQGDSANGT